MGIDISNPLPIIGNTQALSGPDFEHALRQNGQWPLVRGQVKTVQVNVGKALQPGLSPLPRRRWPETQ